MARHIFQAFPVWIHTQSNITNIIEIIDRSYELTRGGGIGLPLENTNSDPAI